MKCLAPSMQRDTPSLDVETRLSFGPSSNHPVRGSRRLYPSLWAIQGGEQTWENGSARVADEQGGLGGDSERKKRTTALAI
jgi:hypothetical protein